MEVKVGATIEITEPTKRIIDYCKEHLVLDNPEYIKKQRMGFWIGNTPPKLELYVKEKDKLILPYGLQDDLIDEFYKADLFTYNYVVPKEVDFGKPVPLYDYQVIAARMLEAAEHGILQSKAGSGKTQIGIALIKLFGVRTLWITQTIDLLNQSKTRAEQYIDKKLIGTITEGKVNINDLTFATVQTLSKIDLQKYKDYWDLIIVDECHRVCGSPTSLTMFYKVLNNLSARHKYGLSATVHRSDGLIKATYAMLGRIAYAVPEEKVADKVMKVGVQVVNTGLKLDYECLNTDGTVNYPKLLTYITSNEERNDLIIEKIIKNKDSPSLILSDRLKHLEMLRNKLPINLLMDSTMVSGSMNTKQGKEERKQALEKMRTGKLKYLFATYQLCKEGLDIPCLERLYMTTPQRDYAVVTQSIGRVDRICEGKKPPIVYDFVDDMGYAVKCYKDRKSIYKKNNCYWIEDE